MDGKNFDAYRAEAAANKRRKKTDSAEPCGIPKGGLLYKVDGVTRRKIESQAAVILADAMRGRYAHDTTVGVWHVYTGTHWAPCDTAAAVEKYIAEALYVGTDPIGFRPGYMAGVIRILTAAAKLPLQSAPAGKIPFRNGLLDIGTRTLSPATPDHAATWCIPHDYTAGTDCPIFFRWLWSATGGDDGLIAVIRAFIAAAITGRADLQKFLNLLGPGGTGKGTLIRLLFAILGPANCVSTDLRQLENNKFETAALYGKRLAVITDSDRYNGTVNVLKAMTGQDPLRNERKNQQQSGSFVFGGMVLIASNEPLSSTDYTSGLDRRRVVVTLDRRIPPEEREVFLAAGGEEALHREIPGIIDWALGLSAEEVTAIFLRPPAKAAAAAHESLLAQNPVADWIAHNLVPERGVWTQIGHKTEYRTSGGRIVYEDADEKLYPNYLTWCHQSGREALALRRFRWAMVDMIRTLGGDVVESRRSLGPGVQGVRLRRETEDLHPWGGVSESYTRAPTGARKNGPEAAKVQDVQDMQDFCAEKILGNQKNYAKKKTYTSCTSCKNNNLIQHQEKESCTSCKNNNLIQCQYVSSGTDDTGVF